jgi:hypothetical protein
MGEQANRPPVLRCANALFVCGSKTAANVRQHKPELPCARTQQGATQRPKIQKAWQTHTPVYGGRQGLATRLRYIPQAEDQVKDNRQRAKRIETEVSTSTNWPSQNPGQCKPLRAVFVTLRHVKRSLTLNFFIPIKLKQRLCHGDD